MGKPSLGHAEVLPSHAGCLWSKQIFILKFVSCTILIIVFYLQEKLKLVTVLGAGLLCGTALAVIVPEGVHALYEDVLEGKKTTLLSWCEVFLHT